MSDQRFRLILPFGLLTAILAVSSSSILTRFAQREAPSLVIAALRLTIASLALAPLALTHYRHELRSVTRREWLLGLLSGIFFATHFATWISSLEYTSIASSVVLVSTGPLWVTLLSPIFLKEPLSRSVLFGMLLALIGGTVIALSDSCSIRWPNSANGARLFLLCPPLSEYLQGKALYGNFLALVGAWTVAGYLMIGRRLRAGISLVPYIFIVFSSAAIFLLVAMTVTAQSPFGFSPATYGWIILLALLPQLTSHSIYNWSLRYLHATVVSTATLAEPVGSAILAFVILDELPTRLNVLGGVLILAGVYLATSTKQPA